MKTTWHNVGTILMAFAAVFLCGYGIGHLVGERRTPSDPGPPPSSSPAWEQQTLETLQASLDLRPEQIAQVEKELSATAQDISKSHQAVLLDYHRHIDRLYERLIKILDEEQAARLRHEKKGLEKQIETLSSE
jgi:hypothetical protein